MRIHDATEQAYKNGYADGFEAGRQSVSMQLTSAWMDAEEEAVKICFKLRDRDWQMSIPLNREEIRMWLAEVDHTEERCTYWGDEYV